MQTDRGPRPTYPPITARLALGATLLLAAGPALADTCEPPTPECHKKNGERLLPTKPGAAAVELLASYRLDERTETLTLYAQAVQADGQYALALETWQRIITFRESEIEAAREAMAGKGSDKARRAAAAKQQKAAQEKSEEAAAEIMKLWPKTAKVRLRGASKVTRGGVEVDPANEILVTAGRDELVVTRADGSTQTLVVEVASQQSKTIEVPAAPSAVPPPTTVTDPAPVIDTRVEGSLTYTEAPRSTTMSRVGIGLGVVGLVGIGVGTTFAFLAKSDYDDAMDLGCDDDGNCPVGRATRRAERSNDRARVAQVSLVGGGALAVTGVVLYLLGNKTTRHEERGVSVSVTPSSIGLSWSLQ